MAKVGNDILHRPFNGEQAWAVAVADSLIRTMQFSASLELMDIPEEGANVQQCVIESANVIADTKLIPPLTISESPESSEYSSPDYRLRLETANLGFLLSYIEDYPDGIGTQEALEAICEDLEEMFFRTPQLFANYLQDTISYIKQETTNASAIVLRLWSIIASHVDYMEVATNTVFPDNPKFFQEYLITLASAFGITLHESGTFDTQHREVFSRANHESSDVINTIFHIQRFFVYDSSSGSHPLRQYYNQVVEKDVNKYLLVLMTYFTEKEIDKILEDSMHAAYLIQIAQESYLLPASIPFLLDASMRLLPPRIRIAISRSSPRIEEMFYIFSLLRYTVQADNPTDAILRQLERIRKMQLEIISDFDEPSELNKFFPVDGVFHSFWAEMFLYIGVLDGEGKKDIVDDIIKRYHECPRRYFRLLQCKQSLIKEIYNLFNTK